MRDSMGDGYGDGGYGQRLDGRAVGRLVAEGGTGDAAEAAEAGELEDAGDAGDATALGEGTAADLARVLSIAAGPPLARGQEPANDEAEERALAAFRAAAPEEPLAAPRASALVRAVRRLGAARSAALALIVTALLGGGVAFAGGGLHLPSSPSPDQPAGGPAATSGASRDTGETGGGERGGERRSQTPDGPAVGPTASERGIPESRTTGGADSRAERQCWVYVRHPEHKRENLLDTPAFEELVSAAGGRDQVAAYCSGAQDQGGDSGDSGDSGDAPWRGGADRPEAGENGAPGGRPAAPSTPDTPESPESPGPVEDSGSPDGSGSPGMPAGGA